jgi:DNA-binding transcriptional regulator YiaG
MKWFYQARRSALAHRASEPRPLLAMKKSGRTLEPLGPLPHRTKIATSFWGRAWCDHLERLGDYANRLPRGRTYVRNGSVRHLAIEKGRITALVQGSRLYEQVVEIDALPAAKWVEIQKRCQGGIGSLIELLQGQLSDEIMAVVTDPTEGLFPKPREIRVGCTCPDWAALCKHLAAVLYGVGARLDHEPELLFVLRGVDHQELIDEGAVSSAIAGSTRRGGRRRTLDEALIGEVFGIDLGELPASDLAPAPTPPPAPPPAPAPAPGAMPKGREGRVSGEAAASGRGTTRSKASAGGKAAKGKAVTGKAAKTKAAATKAAKGASPSPRPFRATGASVKKLRDRLGMTRARFARAVGVTAQTVTNWEVQRGALKMRAANLERLQALHRASLDP